MNGDWFAVDGNFGQHPKRAELLAEHRDQHDTAVALWLFAGNWCRRYKEESGFVPVAVARGVGVAGDPDLAAAALVAVGLWVVVDDPPGWTFHDWADWNGPEAKARRIEKRMANDRARQQRRRSPTDVDEHGTGPPGTGGGDVT